MEHHPFRKIIVLLGYLFGIGGLLYLIVTLSLWLIAPTPPVDTTEKTGLSQTTIEKVLRPITDRFSLPFPTSLHTTYTLSEYDIISAELTKQLEQDNIEVYRIQASVGYDIHIYDHQKKLYILHFKPQQEQQVKVVSTNSTTQAKIGLLFSNVGSSNITDLTDIKRPLNFAIHPHQPFSLRIAKQAAHHWHEVILEENTTSPHWQSLPFVSGILTEQKITLPSQFLQVFSPQQSNIVSVDTINATTLAQSWEIATVTAQQEGSAIILLPIKKSDVKLITAWVASIPKEQKLSLLSEL